MTRYTTSLGKLERAEELAEEVMGRAFGENASGVTWMGDVWGLLNQATGKLATASAMLEAEGGWDALGAQPEPPKPAAELHMVGVTVLWCEQDDENDYPTGWVAHAVLSDGTCSWPHGATPWQQKPNAYEEAARIRWQPDKKWAEVVPEEGGDD